LTTSEAEANSVAERGVSLPAIPAVFGIIWTLLVC
jgi:hypothetical protein